MHGHPVAQRELDVPQEGVGIGRGVTYFLASAIQLPACEDGLIRRRDGAIARARNKGLSGRGMRKSTEASCEDRASDRVS